MELKSAYNSGNPSFFYGAQHSQSVKNLKTFTASGSSSLVHTAGNPSISGNYTAKNNGPKQSVKLSSKNTN